MVDSDDDNAGRMPGLIDVARTVRPQARNECALHEAWQRVQEPTV